MPRDGTGLDTGQGEAAVVAAVADSGSGNRALHLAATEGRMDVCRYLVEDLRLDVNQPNDRGFGPLRFDFAAHTRIQFCSSYTNWKKSIGLYRFF